MTKNQHRLRFDRFTVEDSEYPPFLHMAPHTDKLPRISIILDGDLRETHGSQSINATRGCLVIKPGHVIHENTFGSKPVRSLSISFHDEHLFTQHFENWEWFKDPKLNVLGIRFWTEVRNIRSEESLMRCFNEFLYTVGTLRHNDSVVPVFWIAELKKLIEEGICDADNIYLLSKKLRLHRVYLSRAFKKYNGASPVEFRKYVRISAAFFDLILTKKSLAAIAYDAGFSDQSHMTREFIKFAGLTPGQFRKLTKKN